MRAIVTMAASVLLLVGCSTNATPPPQASPQASSASTGAWRVVPLNATSTDRSVILVNEETGDTWIYNGADQWTPVKRP